jgi:hypothetical protein
MSLTTVYEFTLPRGYVDHHGREHRTGAMRLATARDELEPLRDPTVSGPEDPRLTILVLTRVVTRLGDLELVTSHDIENLFAVDLAFLQDFYGVINFGTQEEYDALIQAQQDSQLIGRGPRPTPQSSTPSPGSSESPAGAAGVASDESGDRPVEEQPQRRTRAAVEEISRRSG